jgi:hypothetical protein
MPTITETPTATNDETNQQEYRQFGAGRYSPMMESIYKGAQTVFKLNPKAAEKLARQCGAEYGSYMANIPVNGAVSRKITKLNQVTLTDASGKMKGIICTPALFAIRALQYASEAGQFGFKYSQGWELEGKFGEYLRSL